MTGRQVIAAVALAVTATAVLPPGAAWSVNRWRVGRAREDVTVLADRLRPQAGTWNGASSPAVLHGTGRMPKTELESTSQWTIAPRASLAGVIKTTDALRSDPWGNSYLVNVGAGAQARCWVLSAGPNGTVETPFSGSGNVASGDDVAAEIR